MKRKNMLLLVLAGLGVGNLLAVAGTRPTDPEWNELTRETVTPHIDWAVPYAKGPIRVLSIDNREHQRDLIELAQRLDIAYEFLNQYPFGFTFPPDTTIFNYEGDEYDVKLERFNELIAKDIDVIVMGSQVIFRVFPDEVIYKIFKKVQDGTGLVIMNKYNTTGDGAPVAYKSELPEIKKLLEETAPRIKDENHFLSAGVPFDSLRTWETILSVTAFENKMQLRRFGKGRIVILSELLPHWGSVADGRFTPPMPRPGIPLPYPKDGRIEREPVEDEYYYAFAAKAVLWAARKEPAVLVDTLVVKNDSGAATRSVAAEIMQKCFVELRLKGGLDQTYKTDWSVRSQSGEGAVIHSDSTVTDNGETKWPLPQLPAGAYFIDAWIKDGKGKIINWGSTAIKVESVVGIVAVTADKNSIKPGETVKVTIRLKGDSIKSGIVQVKAIGNYGRFLAKENLAVNQGMKEMVWEYRHTDRIGRWLILEAELQEGTRVVDVKRAEIPVRLPFGGLDEWHPIGMGGADQSPTARNLGRFMEQSGVDYAEHGGCNPIYAESDIPLLRAARADARANLKTYYRTSSYNPVQNLENINHPCFNDPEYREKYRQTIQSNVDVMKPFGVVYSLGDENFFSNGKDTCLCQYCSARFTEYVRKQYGTLTKLNLSWGTNLADWSEATPLDYEKAQKSGQIPRWVDHKRHMAEEWGAWYAQQVKWVHERDPETKAGMLYLQEREGMVQALRGVEIMMATPSYLEADGDIVRSLDMPGTLKGGFCGWAWHLDRGEGQKRFFWDTFLSGARLGMFETGGPGHLEGYVTPDLRWYAFIHKFFIEFDQIRKGLDKLIFTSRKYPIPVGILYSEPSRYGPRILGQSYDTFQCFRIFRDLCWNANIENNLIPDADIDNNTVKLSDYQLIVLPFVTLLSREGAAKLTEYVQKGGVVLADVRPGIMDEHGKKYEKGILDELFDADAVKSGQDRSAKIKQYGAGYAVLLNIPAELGKYDPEVKSGIRISLTNVFKTAKIQAPFTAPVQRFGHYVDGPCEYTIILDETGKNCPVSFQKRGYLYDARNARFLGLTNSAQISLVKNEGRLISLLPYKVAAIELSGAEKIRQGEQPSFEIRVKREGDGKLERHVFAVEVFNPAGREIRYYQQDVIGMDGKATVTIPCCLNEQTGTWKIRVRDVATGLTANRGFMIEE